MKLKKNLIWLLTILITNFFFTLPAKAQVTIGQNIEPQSFSILELISGTAVDEGRGLRLPQLNNGERTAVQAKFNETAATAEAAEGLVIFNTDNNCLE